MVVQSNLAADIDLLQPNAASELQVSDFVFNSSN